MQIDEAHRTFLLQALGYTRVIVPQFFVQAATTSIAVKACLLADSAELALLAMIHIILLSIVIEQTAD